MAGAVGASGGKSGRTWNKVCGWGAWGDGEGGMLAVGQGWSWRPPRGPARGREHRDTTKTGSWQKTGEERGKGFAFEYTEQDVRRQRSGRN